MTDEDKPLIDLYKRIDDAKNETPTRDDQEARAEAATYVLKLAGTLEEEEEDLEE